MDERRRSRERKQLVSKRCRHTNRIGGLLMTHGIRGFVPRRKDWQKQLDGLRTWDGQPLPACAQVARGALGALRRDGETPLNRTKKLQP